MKYLHFSVKRFLEVHSRSASRTDGTLNELTMLYATGFFEGAAGTDSRGHGAVANFSGGTYSNTKRPVAAIVGASHKL